MNGMLLKDLYIIRATGKSYLGIIVVFVVLVLTGIYDITFFNAMFVMLLTMMPVSVFAYDEQAGWEKFAVATPAGRAGVVGGKYLFALVMWGVSLASSALLTVVACLVHPEKFPLGESLISGLLVVCVGLLMLEVLMPLIFKFGSQKSRIVLMLVVGVMTGVGVAVSMMLDDGLAIPVELVGVMLAAVILGGLAISYFTSLSIFTNKEL